MIGLTLSATADDLALQYLAAVGRGARPRHIIDAMNARGYRISHAVGLRRRDEKPRFLASTPTSLAARSCCPKEPEAVLLGSAMLGAVAAKRYASVAAAMAAAEFRHDASSPPAAKYVPSTRRNTPSSTASTPTSSPTTAS